MSDAAALSLSQAQANRSLPWLVALITVAAILALAMFVPHPRPVPFPLPADPSAAPLGAPPLAALPARPQESAALAVPALPPQDARALNAADALVAEALEQPRPFRFTGSDEDRTRAIHCLALAALAEAGGSEVGQRAVMQVVLNRVRHPAYVPTVCGVVFQGSERPTGCQFSFTCDGALARSYSPALWSAAEKRARAALTGAIDRTVGTATHYHTDWVYPDWSGQLLKIAQVETHLFFRWPGYWGSAQAARIAYRGGEPDPAVLEGRAQATTNATTNAATSGYATPAIKAAPVATASLAPAARAAGTVVGRHPDGNSFLLSLSPSATVAEVAALGRGVCTGKSYCQVWAWREGQAPAGFPLTAATRRTLAASFVREASGAEIAYYDCDRFKGVPRDQCLPKAGKKVT